MNNNQTIETEHLPSVKRSRKSPRACDSCRSRRIKCVPFFSTTSTTNESPICTYCHNHSINCTWDQPITQTRYQPRRKNHIQKSLDPHYHHKSPHAHQALNDQNQYTGPIQSNLNTNYLDSNLASSSSSSSDNQPSSHSRPTSYETRRDSSASNTDPQDHRIYGHTSMSYIMHSTRSFPIARLGQYDHRYAQTSEINDHGDGIIKVFELNSNRDQEPEAADDDGDEETNSDSGNHSSHSLVRTSTNRLEPNNHRSSSSTSSSTSSSPSSSLHSNQRRSSSSTSHRASSSKNQSTDRPKSNIISSDEINQLLMYYFRTYSPFAPMIDQSQFLHLTGWNDLTDKDKNQINLADHSSNPNFLLVMTLCGLASMHHPVSPDLRLGIRRRLETYYQQNQILACSNIKCILSLLAAGFSLEFEIHGAGQICWNATGAAVRMAQSLGLHRRVGSSQHSEIHKELRRRVWSCCVITDRWVSAVFGLPMAIDISDSDNLPTPNDPEYIRNLENRNQHYLGHFALQGLSVILGQVIKTLYSPSSLSYLKDAQVVQLVNELNSWHSQLDIITDQAILGHLLLAAVSVELLLFRPFMKDETSKPETLKYEMIQADFDRLTLRSKNGILWTSSNSHALEGKIIGQYSFFVCCLVQYHAYVGQENLDALETLRKATQVIKNIQTSDCFVRKRVHDVVHALYAEASTMRQTRQELEKRKRARLFGSDQNLAYEQARRAGSVTAVLTHSTKGIETVDKSIKSTNAYELPSVGVSSDPEKLWWRNVSGIYDVNPYSIKTNPTELSWNLQSFKSQDWNVWPGMDGLSQKSLTDFGFFPNPLQADGGRIDQRKTIQESDCDTDNTREFLSTLMDVVPLSSAGTGGHVAVAPTSARVGETQASLVSSCSTVPPTGSERTNSMNPSSSWTSNVNVDPVSSLFAPTHEYNHFPYPGFQTTETGLPIAHDHHTQPDLLERSAASESSSAHAIPPLGSSSNLNHSDSLNFSSSILSMFAGNM